MNPTRSVRRVPAALMLAGTLAIASTGVTATLGAMPAEEPPVDRSPPGERVVIDDGHVDLGPRFVEGRWRFQLHDDTAQPMVWRALSDVVVAADDRVRTEVPDDPALRFLGEPGSDVWVLPQNQQPGVVWPGWSTQDDEVVERVSDPVTWTLDEVDGPGSMVLYLTSGLGEHQVVFSGGSAPAAGDPGATSTEVPIDTHAHGSWVFTAPGAYRITMTMAATDVDGERHSDTATLQVAVGDVDPAEVFALGDETIDDAGAPDAGAATGGDDGSLVDPAAVDEGDGVLLVAIVAVGVVLVVGAVGVASVRRSRRRTSAAEAPSRDDAESGP